jgi:trk system potassium uptake protein TrkA
MKILILGCGRTGAHLAGLLDRDHHQVTILDLDSYAFRRLPADFHGTALVGNGLDQEILRRAGIEETEVFIALSQGDNRNIMAVQIAKHIFNVKRVICRIYDPLRQEIYETLGIETFSPTTIFAGVLRGQIEGRGQ